MLIHDLNLRLETASGACVLFDSATIRHSTEECAPSGPGQAARTGIALQCRKEVSGVRAVHTHQPLPFAHVLVWTGWLRIIVSVLCKHRQAHPTLCMLSKCMHHSCAKV